MRRKVRFLLFLIQAATFLWTFSRYRALPSMESLEQALDEGRSITTARLGEGAERTEHALSNVGLTADGAMRTATTAVGVSDLEPGPSPSISIVVPARNETGRIGPLLSGLRQMAARGLEVLVVDDASVDGTAELVEAAGVRCLPLGEGLPPGWVGKSWACRRGVQETQGDWLLFVDADVELSPDAPERFARVSEAKEYALFSVFLRQRCDSFWERALLPYMYCLYFAGGGGRGVNSAPAKALANGQCLMIRRSHYEATGGHAIVRSSVIEDVALARAFVQRGLAVGVARAPDLGSVRMYDSLPAIRLGFGKNAADFTRAMGVSGLRTAGLSMLSVALGIHLARRPTVGVAFAWLLSAGCLSRWYRSFGARPAYALLHPVVAVVTHAIVLEGILRRLTGTLTWKARSLP